jgi:hypothetical protein
MTHVCFWWKKWSLGCAPNGPDAFYSVILVKVYFHQKTVIYEID